MNYPLSRQSGLTLLELLLALGIFAVVSVMAYSGLQNVIIADERIEYHSKQLLSLQRSFLTIAQDLTYLTGRPIRDRFGDNQSPFTASEQGVYQLEFTRSSWFNPGNLSRSTLQRVAYGIEDQHLVRYHWLMLDQAQDSEPFKSTLLKDVEQLKIRLLDSQEEWHDSWPPLNPQTASQPKGVEITLSIKGLGDIRRLYRTTEYQW